MTILFFIFFISPCFSMPQALENSLVEGSGILQSSPIEQHYKDLSGGIEKELSTNKKDLEILLQKQMRLEMGPSEGPRDFFGLEDIKSREKLKNFLPK